MEGFKNQEIRGCILSKVKKEYFLKQQEKLNKQFPERKKYGTNIRTCSESCAIFLKCPKYANSRGNLCKIVTDYQKDLKTKLDNIPNLSVQDLIIAEFAFGNLLKIRELENLITIEGFITKAEDGNFTSHSLTEVLLKMQRSVKDFLMQTKKGGTEGQGTKDNSSGNRWIPYSEILKEASEVKDKSSDKAKDTKSEKSKTDKEEAE